MQKTQLDSFMPFDRTPTCDRQMDGHRRTHGRGIYHTYNDTVGLCSYDLKALYKYDPDYYHYYVKLFIHHKFNVQGTLTYEYMYTYTVQLRLQQWHWHWDSCRNAAASGPRCKLAAEDQVWFKSRFWFTVESRRKITLPPCDRANQAGVSKLRSHLQQRSSLSEVAQQETGPIVGSTEMQEDMKLLYEVKMADQL